MSTTLLKIAAVSAVSFAAMATSAQAQSRYGDINAYEGSGDCMPSACAPAATAQSSRYGSTTTVAPAYNTAPVYVDCTVTGTCGPAVVAQPTTVYTQPYGQQSYTQAAPTIQMYEQPAMAVNCPPGTTAQPDGTCMQTGASAGPIASYSSGSWSSTTTTSMPADCPAGTTAQSDGTCMQTGSSYGSTSYSSSTTYADTAPVMSANCPAGTTAQADGTCAQGSSYSTTSYVGDATPSYGYSTDGSYGADTYLPIRK